tara:strand:- start:1294 stop:1632 length:339 start_codon:yes stop_codon:yes gene_type:complete
LVVENTFDTEKGEEDRINKNRREIIIFPHEIVKEYRHCNIGTVIKKRRLFKYSSKRCEKDKDYYRVYIYILLTAMLDNNDLCDTLLVSYLASCKQLENFNKYYSTFVYFVCL